VPAHPSCLQQLWNTEARSLGRTGGQPLSILQLAVLQVSLKRPKLQTRDRVFCVWVSRLWADWRSSLLIVKSEVYNGFGLWRNCGAVAFNMCNMVSAWSDAKSRQLPPFSVTS